jgi:glucose-1-phosphate thymidylyltransferase
MSAGIKEILIICNPSEVHMFHDLLADGSSLGINISYQVQEKPKGIAEAFILGEEFIEDSSVCLILGDNIFVGPGLGRQLRNESVNEGAKILLYQVENPTRYGNVELDQFQNIIRIVEKPKTPLSDYIVPGLYFFDNSVVRRSKQLIPSERGELEITDLLSGYLSDSKLQNIKLARGSVWFDTGTHETLFNASEYIRIIQQLQGVMIGSPEEMAFINGWLSNTELEKTRGFSMSSSYGEYLRNLIKMK